MTTSHLPIASLTALRAGLAVAVRPNPLLTSLVLAVSDLTAVVAAATLAFGVWVHINPAVSQLYLHLWPAAGLFAMVFAIEGLYPGVGVTPVEELQRLARSTSIVYLLLAAAIFLSKTGQAQSRGVFAAAWLFSLVLLPASRAFVYWLFAPRPWWGAPVLVLGSSEMAQRVIAELHAKKAIGLKPLACLSQEEPAGGCCAGTPVLGTLDCAAGMAHSLHIKHAILAMPEVRRARLLELLEEFSGIFPHVILVPDLFGIATLWVAPRDLGGVLGLEVRHNLLMPLNRWVKRVFDLLLGSLAGIAALPIIGAAVVWIRCVSPGPAIFWHQREGENGAPLRIPKLRTMYPDAETMLLGYLDSNPAARDEWERYCKLKRDPRVLPGIGTLLRRTSLDELPQLWNIVKGEMSLVGPRPFPDYHNRKFEPEFRAFRTKVTPGLTGLWQISDRSDGDLKVQAKLDSYYIRNWSPWLDIYILGRTLLAVLSGKGAY